MARDETKVIGLPPLSKFGLRVRLFSGEDVPRLASISGRSLKNNIEYDEVAERLNLAFIGAHACAEGARFDFSPADREKNCKAIASKGRQFLQALGLPPEPHAYTREGVLGTMRGADDLFRMSPMANLLRRVVPAAEPLPEPIISWDSASVDTVEHVRLGLQAVQAAREIPLTVGMLPTSIAQEILPSELIHDRIPEISRNVAKEMRENPRHIKARAMVYALLEMAPSAVALLVALAEIAETDPKYSDPHKQNYSRTFGWVLFHFLAHTYFDAFGRPPTTSDRMRGPKGPASRWVDAVMRLASRRRDCIAVKRVEDVPLFRDVPLADETERERLVAAIRAVANLKISVKAKELGKGWRLNRSPPS